MYAYAHCRDALPASDRCDAITPLPARAAVVNNRAYRNNRGTTTLYRVAWPRHMTYARLRHAGRRGLLRHCCTIVFLLPTTRTVTRGACRHACYRTAPGMTATPRLALNVPRHQHAPHAAGDNNVHSAFIARLSPLNVAAA